MSDIKQVQIIIRATEEEKAEITKKAKEKGVSVNEFIKKSVLYNDNTSDNKENKNDINGDIIKILREQLNAKDMQIANLQQIIYNRDTKLLEAPKHWWEFWK